MYMSTNLTVAGRLQLAGYAGTAAGILRSRVHPLIAVSVVDILAVALGLGALYVAGVMVTGSHPAQFIASETAVGNAAAQPARTAPIVAAQTPAAQKTPAARPAVVYAALPTDEVFFSDPVYIGGEVAPGEYACGFPNCVDHFVTPVEIAAAEEPSAVTPPADVASTDDTAHAPVDKIIGISGVARSAARAVGTVAKTALPVAIAADTQDGVGAKVATPVASAASVAGGNVGATVGAGDTSVSAYAPVGQAVAPAVQAVTDAAAPVTQPVAQAVGVTGLGP